MFSRTRLGLPWSILGWTSVKRIGTRGREEVFREKGGFAQYGLLVVTALADTESTHTQPIKISKATGHIKERDRKDDRPLRVSLLVRSACA